MIPSHQAEQLILDQVSPFNSSHDCETVDLMSANGRILARPITSQLDFPHWDNSAMDGYAVRFDDVATCSPQSPITLHIVEEIPAGYCPALTIQPGQAARILTGSMMPAGADTVVMQENTQRDGDRVTILQAPTPQAFVRHRGVYYRAGEPLLSVGIRLSAPEIAVLAAAQCSAIEVFRRPRVAILSTGSELVTPDQPLKPGQIVDSNQYALAALVAETGADVLMMGVVPDHPAALEHAIAQALAQADLVLSSGGVSVGDYDYVDRILAELGGVLHIRAVAVKPGKPLTVATFEREGNRPKLYFGLPGNPVSALVTFWRFVQPALRKLSGLRDQWGPLFINGVSMVDLKADGKREAYIWGRSHWVDGNHQFQPAGGTHLSGNLINLADTNSLAIVPIGQTMIPAGQPVSLMLVG